MQAQALGGSLLPCWRAERLAAVHAQTQGVEFFFRLRPIDAFRPIARQAHRARAEEFLDWIGRVGQPVGEAAPAPVFRSPAKASPQGVSFGIAQDG